MSCDTEQTESRPNENERVEFVKSLGEFFEFDEKERIVTGVLTGEIVDSHGHLLPISELVKIADKLISRRTPICREHTSGAHGYLTDYEEGIKDEKNVLFIKVKIFDDFRLDHEFWNDIIKGKLRQFSLKATGFVKTECDTTKCWQKANSIEVVEISAVKSGANKMADILVPLQKSKSDNMTNENEDASGTPQPNGGELLLALTKSMTDFTDSQKTINASFSTRFEKIDEKIDALLLVKAEDKPEDDKSKGEKPKGGPPGEDTPKDKDDSKEESKDESDKSGEKKEDLVKSLGEMMDSKLTEFKKNFSVGSFNTPGAGDSGANPKVVALTKSEFQTNVDKISKGRTLPTENQLAKSLGYN